MPKLNSMYDIVKICKTKKECAEVEYLKVATGGNDPTISKAMRYSQYVQTQTPQIVIDYKTPAPLPMQPSTFKQTLVRAYGVGYLAVKPAMGWTYNASQT